jgi:hypothetical protein
MMKENKKVYYIALLWLVMGYLCHWTALYSFDRWVFPVKNFVTAEIHSRYILTVTNFLVFYIADFFFVLLFTLILSLIMGKKALWIFAFLIGAVGYPLYMTIYSMIFYFNFYNVLPSWVMLYRVEAIIYFIATSLIAWSGVVLGNKCKEKYNKINTAVRQAMPASR